MAGYTFDKCSDFALWDNFVESSPQGTIFSKSRFVECLGEKSSNYLVFKGQEIVGGVTVLEDDAGEPLSAPYPLTPYQGILFKSFDKQNHKKISEEFKITEFIIAKLMEAYGRISLSHSPYLRDIRAFQWFNYHARDRGLFNISVHYTALLDLNFNTLDEYLMRIRTARRQEYNKKAEYKIYETEDWEVLDQLHELTFNRQDQKRSEIEVRLARSIAQNAVKNKFGRISICEINEKPASACLFLYDRKRGYYMIGANNPETRLTGCSTKLLVENIIHAKEEQKLGQIDFVGCNSPNRGDYKLSFNGRLLPHYRTNFRAENLKSRQ